MNSFDEWPGVVTHPAKTIVRHIRFPESCDLQQLKNPILLMLPCSAISKVFITASFSKADGLHYAIRMRHGQSQYSARQPGPSHREPVVVPRAESALLMDSCDLQGGLWIIPMECIYQCCQGLNQDEGPNS